MSPDHPAYTPHILLDSIKDQFKIKTDKELAEFIGTTSPQISRVRIGHHRLTPTMILAIHEATDWTPKFIRELHNQQLLLNAKANRGGK